jgi:hypothetical protein
VNYRIIITAGSVTVEAERNDSPTAQLIWEALPITGRANTWGDEIYFDIPKVGFFTSSHSVVYFGAGL